MLGNNYETETSPLTMGVKSHQPCEKIFRNFRAAVLELSQVNKMRPVYGFKIGKMSPQ